MTDGIIRGFSASMRPRHENRGSRCRGELRKDGYARFNEAAALKPRKRYIEGLTITQGDGRFNEAAALKPRKPSIASRMMPSRCAASMRPRH